MSLIIPPDCMHVVQPLRHALQTTPATVTYAIRFDGILPVIATAQQVINDLFTNFKTTMDDGLDSQVSILPCVGYFNQNVAAGTVNTVLATGATGVGLRVGSSVTPNVAGAVTKRTLIAGRSGRGRMFIPWWLDETNVDEAGIINAASITNRQGDVDDLLNGIIGVANCEGMVLLHDSGSPLAGDSTLVTNLFVRDVVRTQRRRLRL